MRKQIFVTGGAGFTGPVNLVNPDEISILDLARLIIDSTGSKSKIVLKSLSQDDPKRRYT